MICKKQWGLGHIWKLQRLEWMSGWSLPGTLAFPRHTLSPAVGMKQAVQQGGPGDREPLPSPPTPLPHKTFSPHLTPSQPVSPHSPCLFIAERLLGSRTCCFPFLHMKLSWHPSNSFATVLSTLSSHLLIAKFGLFFTPVFGTADHSSSCDLRGTDLFWFSSYFSDGSF